MRQRHLPKLIFTLSFLVAAALSIGFVLGYRINIKERIIEKRGVLSLQGDGMVEVHIDDHFYSTTLPHVDTNVPLGIHQLVVKQPYSIPFHSTIQVSEEHAAVVDVLLPPDLSKLAASTFIQDDTHLVFLTVNQHIFVYNIPQKLLEVYDDKERMMIKSPSFTVPLNIAPKDIHAITDGSYLLTDEEGHYGILDSSTLELAPLNTSDEYFPCFHLLCSYGASTLSVSSPLRPEEKEVIAEHVAAYHKEVNSIIYRDTSNNRYLLDISSLKNIKSTSLDESTDEIIQENSPLHLTASGALMSKASPLPLITNVVSYNTEYPDLFVGRNNGDLYKITDAASTFMGKFNSIIRSMQRIDSQRLMVETSKEVFLCSIDDTFQCVSFISTDDPLDQVHYDNESHMLILSTKDDSTTMIQVYALPIQ